jgi:hypothetical protein
MFTTTLMWLCNHAVLVTCSQKDAGACRRFVAGGGTVPWVSKALSASAALQLAEACCKAGPLDDEAPLLRLLHNCIAALHADVSAAASARGPAAAAGVATADGLAAGAARAQAGPAAAKSAIHSQGAASAQQQPASAGRVQHADGAQLGTQLSAQQLMSKNLPHQLHRGLAEQLEWESTWTFPVVSALQARHASNGAKLDAHCAEITYTHLGALVAASTSLTSCGCVRV